MKTTFDKSEAVIVAHYQGLTVSQLDELRSKMREHGIQFKITKNRITAGRKLKMLISDIRNENPKAPKNSLANTFPKSKAMINAEKVTTNISSKN